MNKFAISQCITVLAAACIPTVGFSGAYVFAGESNGVNVVTHPQGYTGAATSSLNINVCINPASSQTTSLEVAVQNIVDTWNGLHVVDDNLRTDADMAFSEFDWESVVLHEVGHCIGLAHPNLGGSGGTSNHTNSTDGADNTINAGAGLDGIIGSADDVRGDDINLHWFNIGVNNPYVTSPPFESSQYSRDLADLPLSDNYAANADRAVGDDLGFANSEAVMQQGTTNNEAQRFLGADDVATIRLAMSGIDMSEGNGDDYRYRLSYGGITTGCDINITHSSGGGFASCSLGGTSVGGNHLSITSANISVNDSFNWFFNQKRNDLIFKNSYQRYD